MRRVVSYVGNMESKIIVMLLLIMLKYWDDMLELMEMVMKYSMGIYKNLLVFLFFF